MGTFPLEKMAETPSNQGLGYFSRSKFGLAARRSLPLVRHYQARRPVKKSALAARRAVSFGRRARREPVAHSLHIH